MGKATPPDPLAAARALERAGRRADAFDAYRALIAARPSSAATSAFGAFLIANTPSHPHPSIDAALHAALAAPWVRPELLAPAVARYLDAKWPGAIARGLPAQAADLLALGPVRGLLGDPLLAELLRATPAATPALDIFLARARHAALAAAAAGADLTALLPWLVALAERAMASDFALTLPAREVDAPHSAAEPGLRAALARCPPGAATIALAACYARLAERPAFAELAPIVAAQIDAPARETTLAAALPVLTPLPEDDPVRAQYEAHPYPRWAREPLGVPVPLPAPVARRVAKAPVARVLVAGCGTGQHALTARDRWPGADILAIDLSRASLGHAARKAEKLPGLRFALADLMAAASLGGPFDAIEAAGVLHHLADPAAGLKALAGVLAPRGVMLVALYARAARGALPAARALVGEWPRDDAALRAWRAQALAGGAAPEITHAPDFYALGGCRDLVFHARETAYDLGEVGALVAAAGLKPLALEPPPLALPRPPAPDDLAGWAREERRAPAMFGGMYQLWVTRDAGAGRRG